MRTFTTLCIAATLALATNAAIIDKREISAPVSECVGLIDSSKAKFNAFGVTIAAFTDSDKDEALLANSESVLAALESTKDKCCAINIDPSAEEDGKAFSGALENYSKAAVAAFDALKSNSAALDTGRIARDHVKEELYNFMKRSYPLNECLIQRAPTAEAANVKDSISKVDSAFLALTDAFEVYLHDDLAQEQS